MPTPAGGRHSRRPREVTAEETDQSSKRTRISLACLNCRSRKTRCDGVRPKCAPCRSLGFECSYVQSASSANVIIGKEYLSDIETRLARVESELHSLTSSGSLAQGPKTSSPQPRAVTPRRDVSGITLYQPFHHRSDEAEGSTDGIGSISFADEEDAAFLGPSSNIAFMRHLGPALARISPANANGAYTADKSSQLEGDIVRASRRASPDISHNKGMTRDEDVFTLPQPPEVERLLDTYFSNTGLLFPFIHEQSFRSKYNDMNHSRDGLKSVSKTWLALLNMLLAFATSTSPNVSYPDRQGASDVFYSRSISLCKEQLVRASNLETVQLQLLISQYLQGSQKSLQTWMLHGLAVKAAMQLGLHSRAANASTNFTPVEREFRKRTWYGCIILDRTLSMTFGRPPSIPEEYIQIELPSLDLLICPTVSQIDRVHESSLMFYNATIILSSILNTTIRQCYGSNLGCDSTTDGIAKINRVLTLENQLQQWKRALPESVDLWNHQLDHDIEDCFITRFRVVLTLRFLNIRILTHRPILSDILDTAGKATITEDSNHLLKQMSAYNLECCLESAKEIILIVRNALRQCRLHLGAWWFTLYYTFNAALVIGAIIVIRYSARTNTSLDLSHSEDIRTYLDAAIEGLTLLDRQNRMVDKCKDHLGRLAAALDTILKPTLPFSECSNNQSALQDAGRMTELLAPTEPLSGLLRPSTDIGSGIENISSTLPDVSDVSNPFNPFGTSPNGLELGEFLTDEDTEILRAFFG